MYGTGYLHTAYRSGGVPEFRFLNYSFRIVVVVNRRKP